MHLLITDVVMPVLDGHALAEQFRSLRPEGRVLFTSGYTPESVSRRGIVIPAAQFIQKPYSPAALCRHVRTMLDGLMPHSLVVVFVVVFFAADVMARVLVQKGQRLEGAHPIEEQHAVQVIGFVLDDPRGKIVGLDLDALALAVEGTDLDVRRSWHATPDVRNAQAPLPSLDGLRAESS